MERHHLTVNRVPSKCETPGHTDLKVDCSCGFEVTLLHGDRIDVEKTVLYHRLDAVEKAVGISISVEWKSGA